ncbi:unnamed protein product [Polarella glacialis]|uniref:Small ribosomal subunit protein uS10 domain-containing protein n=1 Tax=Polarella glacialis TaxID=89957 RepID=A0A813K666_POLGL|nr:unnamed protein product [Polarella glacialis]|mmetsp:Transcript_18624/g.33073  ORF Transcript_18624/g.33073 Transcript_18624/m.33073 type:complete len:217 (-) Transcript_18624:203-853(-)
MAGPVTMMSCVALVLFLSASSLGFVGNSLGSASRVPLAAQPRALAQHRFGLAPPAAAVETSSYRATPLWNATAAAFAVALVWSARRASPLVARRAIGKIAVRQWAPQKIPASIRRAPEDRIRINMFAGHPVCLMEAVEVLEDFAKETGGEIEGPVVKPYKKIQHYLNKSPKGHKKSKYHWKKEEHEWQVDYYPPKEGGLESIMRLRLPHTVLVKIE